MAPVLLDSIPPSSQDLKGFLDRHETLLQLERKEEEDQTRLLNSNCSARELERKGLSLGGLGVSNISVGLGGKTLVEVHRPAIYHTNPQFPPHTFRNGDPVRIEAHVADNAKTKKKKKDEVEDVSGVEGIVYRVSKEKIVIAVDERKEIDLPERVRLLKLANSVTFDRMDKTVKHLRRIVLPEEAGPTDKDSSSGSVNLPSGNRRVIDALLGVSGPTWAKNIPPTFEQLADSGTTTEQIKWYGDRLNESQKDAIEFCLKAEQVGCIHGPPGTGKTHTLVELVFQLLSRPTTPTSPLPPKILITTPSNLALDNILLRLHTLAQSEPYSTLLPKGSILRLGHPTRVHRELISETLDWRAANGEDGELVKDVRKEIEGHMSDLGKKKGERGAVKGKERGEKWGEVRELRKEYRQREAKVVKNVVNAARVVLATCHSAGSRQINNMNFDVCIVDEATQAIEAVCWVPILKSKRVILAGDPQQLPPTVMSRGKESIQSDQGAKANKSGADDRAEPAKAQTDPPTDIELETKLSTTSMTDRPRLKPPRTLETTMFERLERLYGDGIKRVLKIQYRMNETIAAYPSKKLYNDELISSPLVAKRTLLELPGVTPESDEAKDTLQSTVVFYDTAGCEFYERNESDDNESPGGGKSSVGEGSKSNTNEAEIVIRWARKLVELGVPPEEIAIVTPYQAQVSLIAETLRDDYPEMTVGSVDGLQGQEREAIILSLVRSNSKSEVGFLAEYRRLNVAMTRAKRQLCVIGDSDTVGKGSKYLASWMKWLEDNADVRYAGDMLE